jgi:hypothetical protein
MYCTGKSLKATKKKENIENIERVQMRAMIVLFKGITILMLIVDTSINEI